VRKRFEATRNAIESRGERDDRGAVLFLVFVFLVIFLAVAALAVDLAAVATRGQTLQNTADAASLAAVVEYEKELLTGATESAAEAAARLVAEEILQQNGINPGDPTITMTVDFPASGGRVTVNINDDDPPSYLGSAVVPGLDTKVGRQATAEFLGCDACSVEVKIPRPFSSVSAEGRGDGYKPIRVGDRLYALNHNSRERQIVCIDTVAQAPCWQDAFGNPVASRDAYLDFNHNNPEMPHTAVVGTRIFWSATDTSVGHRLFCFETVTDQPCSTSVQLGDDLRVGQGSSPLESAKDENRGGGTVEVDDRVYVFTDNHEIHCFNPISNNYCSAFQGPAGDPDFRAFGGKPTALDLFPDNDPRDGNHGSSIDRVVDNNTGRIYSTIHIPVAVDSLKCSSAFAVPETNVDALVDQIVVIRNGGQYLSAAGGDNVVLIDRNGDFSDTSVRWRVTQEARGTAVYLEAVGLADENGGNERWLDGEDDFALLPSPIGTDLNKVEPDNAWNLIPGDGLFTIENDGTVDDLGTPTPNFLNRSSVNGVIQQDAADVTPTDWEISRCVDPAVDAGYQAGTWLHCYDTTLAEPCSGFTPSAIHADGSRFSGRLFFYYGPGPLGGGQAPKLGVCSSGYENPLTRTNVDQVEIKCVDLVDGSPNTLGNALSSLASDIDGSTSNSPAAWGDPHYNSFTNRLFYPTEHSFSRIFCWDFQTGNSCGSYVGETRPSAAAPRVKTEDYGFISIDDCVFGLGHLAYFWAFQATDIGEPCVGARSSTVLTACPCTGDSSRWGILDFRELNLDDFDVFSVEITTNPPDPDDRGIRIGEELQLKPLDASQRLIKLDDAATYPIPLGTDSVRVVIYVEAENDPFEDTIRTFDIRFPQVPRLID